MQIIINEDEILEAIKGYISNQGIVTAGREITVELTAGRGPNGSRATVEITKFDGSPTTHEVFTSGNVKTVEKAVDDVEVIDKAAKEKPEPKETSEAAVFPAEEVKEEPPVEVLEESAETPAPSGDSLFGY